MRFVGCDKTKFGSDIPVYISYTTSYKSLREPVQRALLRGDELYVALHTHIIIIDDNY